MKKLSFLLIVILFIAACNNTTTSDQTNIENTEVIEATETVSEIAIIKISGMHCAGCENTITTALTALDGVKDAKVSVEMEAAKVKYDPAKVSPEDIKAAITAKGYEVVEFNTVQPKETPAETVE